MRYRNSHNPFASYRVTRSASSKFISMPRPHAARGRNLSTPLFLALSAFVGFALVMIAMGIIK